MEKPDVAKHLLQEVVNQQVSKALVGIIDKATDTLKKIEGLDESQKLEAGAMVLEMVEVATNMFNQKMKDRLASNRFAESRRAERQTV